MTASSNAGLCLSSFDEKCMSYQSHDLIPSWLYYIAGGAIFKHSLTMLLVSVLPSTNIETHMKSPACLIGGCSATALEGGREGRPGELEPSDRPRPPQNAVAFPTISARCRSRASAVRRPVGPYCVVFLSCGLLLKIRFMLFQNSMQYIKSD